MTEVPAPTEYRVRLAVDFAGLRWSGTVELDAPPGANRLELDCERLQVGSVKVGGHAVPFVHDAGTGVLSFALGESARGPVSIDFTGTVGKALMGLYRSRHGDGYILTSHCEPTGARQIFPCVDRPDRKARIVLTVQVPSDVEVISNSPARTVRALDAGREWAFEPTPLMSTYLFYLGVGRFDFREDRAGAVRVRLAAPPGRADAGAWAVQSAARILQGYERYYGIAYPLPKLDLIAVAEHAFGAMENWGAISFQETRLLVDGASTSFSTRDVFTTAAHEIAHQWFGNLVTMASWDDIWLNESFAALMETKLTEALEPTFDPWNEFIVRVAGKAAALDGDSLRSTHPVRAHVDRPDEMSQIFDEISYGKGSSVLAMLDRYLGEARFRAGVTHYLNSFRYRNARTEDLFASLERTSGEPVSRLAGPWIDRAGVPVVTARSRAGGLALSQARFTYFGPVEEEPWPIPMVLEVNGREERLLFDGRERLLPVPAGATVLLNPGSIGFYRVEYDASLLDRLLRVLPQRPGLDTWAVIDDLAALLYAGRTDWRTYARAVEAFAATPERLVAETLAASLQSLALQYPARPDVSRTARAFLRRQTERIGLDRRDGEPAGTGIARERLTLARARTDAEFAAELAPRFGRWAELDPDLRSAVAISAVRTGGDAGWQAVRRELEHPGSDAEAMRLERALAWSPDPARVREILDAAATGRVNRSHVVGIAYQASLNPVARDVAWAWLQESLDPLAAMFRGSGYLPILLEVAVPLLGTGRSAELRRFFDTHPAPDGTRGLAKGFERLELGERLGARLT